MKNGNNGAGARRSHRRRASFAHQAIAPLRGRKKCMKKNGLEAKISKSLNERIGIKLWLPAKKKYLIAKNEERNISSISRRKKRRSERRKTYLKHRRLGREEPKMKKTDSEKYQK